MAIEAIDQPAEGAGMMDLRALLLSDPATERLAAPVLGQVEPIPPGVAAAIASAAHEALVNVERHARARSWRVELSSLGQKGCEVRVVDDGRGFDTTQNFRGRLGLRRSVVERLDDIGGQAVVRSSPGTGTVVTLVWPRPEASTSLGLPAMGPGLQADWGSRRMMALMVTPGLVLTTVMCVLAGPQMLHFHLSGAVTMVCMAAGAWCCMHLARRPLSRPGLWALLVLTLGTWLVNLLTTPHDVTDVYMLWMSWGLPR
ncbi:sensor histidine kinase [Luteococcus sp.]|uniref:sensor histidine kinase n=1 Tax=Luteococcus sp. TaxID=1969402 RepID=UPI0037364A8C